MLAGRARAPAARGAAGPAGDGEGEGEGADAAPAKRGRGPREYVPRPDTFNYGFLVAMYLVGAGGGVEGGRES